MKNERNTEGSIMFGVHKKFPKYFIIYRQKYNQLLC
jgi:hypothetical protein